MLIGHRHPVWLLMFLVAIGMLFGRKAAAVVTLIAAVLYVIFHI